MKSHWGGKSLLGAGGQKQPRQRSKVTKIDKKDKRVPTGTRCVNVCCNRRECCKELNL